MKFILACNGHSYRNYLIRNHLGEREFRYLHNPNQLRGTADPLVIQIDRDEAFRPSYLSEVHALIACSRGLLSYDLDWDLSHRDASYRSFRIVDNIEPISVEGLRRLEAEMSRIMQHEVDNDIMRDIYGIDQSMLGDEGTAVSVMTREGNIERIPLVPDEWRSSIREALVGYQDEHIDNLIADVECELLKNWARSQTCKKDKLNCEIKKYNAMNKNIPKILEIVSGLTMKGIQS